MVLVRIAKQFIECSPVDLQITWPGRQTLQKSSIPPCYSRAASVLAHRAIHTIVSCVVVGQ